MADHVGAPELAEYQEGLLSARRRAAIGAHLAGCPNCADVARQLAAVSAVLATAPPPQIPPGLVTRLEAALAAEAASARLQAGQVSTAGQAPTSEQVTAVGPVLAGDSGLAGEARGTQGASPGRGPGHAGLPGSPARASVGRPGRSGRRRPPRSPGHSGTRPQGRFVLRIASLAAAAVILGGGGFAISQLSSAGTTASTGSASGAPRSAPPGSSAIRSNPASSGGPHADGGVQGPMRDAYQIVTSGTDYQPGALRAQVSATLARYLPATRLGGTAPTAGGRANRAGTVAGLAGCVRHVAAGLQPDLVDVARYAGHPAIVIAARSGSGQEVWVVGTNCSATGAHIYARLNLTGRG